MKLKKLVKRYNSERDNCHQYQESLARAVNRYREFTGLNQFEYESVNEWLTNLQQHVSNHTVKNYRRYAITLWTYAATLDLCEYPDPRRIKQVKVTNPAPQAWSPEQVMRLVHVAPNAWWKAVIIAGYDTGLRRGDLLRLPRTIENGQRFVIVERKTRQSETRQLSDRGAELLRRLPENELAFPWDKSLTTFGRQFAQIVDAAELTGTFKYLRRTFVTLSGWRHADPGISKKHYIDPTLVDEPVPRPPAITAKQ